MQQASEIMVLILGLGGLIFTFISLAYARKIPYSKILEGNPNPVLRIHKTGKVIYKNKAVDVILHKAGLTKVEALKFLSKDLKISIASSLEKKRSITCPDVKFNDRTYSYSLSPADSNHVNLYAIDITEKIAACSKFKNGEKKFKELFNNMSSGVAVYEAVDNGSNFIFKNFNNSSAVIENMEKKAVIGRKVTEVFPGVEEFGFLSALREVNRTGKPKHFSLSFYKDDRISGWRDNYVYKLSSGDIVAVYDDVTSRKQAEEKTKKALTEKDILLQEIHHRIKNNLILLYGLVNFQQSSYADKKDIYNILENTKLRIRAIGKVHNLLYNRKDLFEIAFPTYVKSVIDEVVNSYNISKKNISVNLDLDPIVLDLNTAIPCALIVNELLTNVFKYAFPGERSGSVNISLKSLDDSIKLEISDTGIGLPKNFTIDRSKRLGLNLVAMLADQLMGKLSYKKNDGATFTVIFKRKEQ